jgi:putative SOS response-associated peptidase YedK
MTAIDHHRMPVILKPVDYRKWLKAEEHLANITELSVKQNPHTSMNAPPVSKLVNSPKNYTTEIMEAIGDKVIQEAQSP